MGKKSRRRREATSVAGPDVGGRTKARSAARGEDRDGRSPVDRYSNVMIGVVAVLGVGLVGYMVFSSATAPAYTCESFVEAPARQLDGELGFPRPMDGAQHVEGSVDYAACPPTSGEHRGGGTLIRAFYGPETEQVPNDWIHNLEHGYAIIAYSGEPDDDTVDALRKAMDAAEPSQVAQECGLANKVIALRFDDMSTPFAVLAWRWALLLDEFDPELITMAASQLQDRPEAPERAC